MPDMRPYTAPTTPAPTRNAAIGSGKPPAHATPEKYRRYSHQPADRDCKDPQQVFLYRLGIGHRVSVSAYHAVFHSAGTALLSAPYNSSSIFLPPA